MQDCVVKMNIVCVFVGMAFLLMDLNSGNLNMICFINNSNRTKSDDREAGVSFVNYEYDYRQNWTTRSPVTNNQNYDKI